MENIAVKKCKALEYLNISSIVKHQGIREFFYKPSE